MILQTNEKKAGGFRWDIWTWKGSGASMVVNGFAGSMAAKLNNLLTANANQRDVVLEHQKQGSEGKVRPILCGSGSRRSCCWWWWCMVVVHGGGGGAWWWS